MSKRFFRSLFFLPLLALPFLSSVKTYGQQEPKGRVERIKVHGKGLEGNLAGDPADRDVSVYLPAGYNKDPKRRYPVVYFLHGFTDDDAQWYGFKKHWINLPQILDKVFAWGGAREMIVVTPNAYNRFHGSFYSNSVTTGNWEDFVSKELVASIDARYRTLARPESRGLCGHSMGGYGGMRIAQKHPEVFSSVYLLSPCCLLPVPNNPPRPEALARQDSVKTVADFEKADFGTRAAFATAAAWAPNPQNPPLYLDLPYQNGQLQPLVQTKLWANMPLATLDQYIPNLKQLRALGFDAGTQDVAIAAGLRALDSSLSVYSIPHQFEIYEGNHINRVGERIEQKMLGFFSQNLSFEERKKK
ncbi:alpha/beta fold hydrolase [Paraflavisolibacter sp. H34]|uniref:alpha/beta hydrolase n=1 Tax=Huijunlia imazamoxiresistens TaxID=3127457 RepID=UPI003018C2DF